MTFTDALAELHRNNCLLDRHDDACLALTAGFDELVEQRDRARRIAVALEQENTQLRRYMTACGICGNAPGDDFDLTTGTHPGCLADVKHDESIDFDFDAVEA